MNAMGVGLGKINLGEKITNKQKKRKERKKSMGALKI